MSAKISIDLGDYYYKITDEEALLIHSGCMGALKQLGLHQLHKPVDLIEVIRVYPVRSRIGETNVEVVTAWGSVKKIDSFCVDLNNDKPLRDYVRGRVLFVANRLLQQIREEIDKNAAEMNSKFVQNATT